MDVGLVGYFQRIWERRPLSTQLVTLIIALLALGLVMSGTVMLGLLQRHLVSQIDDQLQDAALSITLNTAGPLESSQAGVPTLFYIRRTAPGEPTQTFIHSDTEKIAGAPKLPELLAPGIIPDTPTGTTLPVTVHSSKSGLTWRAIAFPIASRGSNSRGAVMTIALPLVNIQRTLRTTTAYFSVAALVIVVFGGYTGHWLVKRSLSPLRSIESTAGKIASGDLTQRVSPRPTTTEVGSLALSLNTMLAQVEQAFESRQASERKIRRFVSDASHELRTPLAAISGYCELYSIGGVPSDRVDEVMGRIRSESTRMSVLVEDLLTLARLDEGRPLDFTTVDLVTMADNAVFDLQALDSSRTVGVIALNGGAPPTVLGVTADKDRIQQVFTNIVGNIVRYTPDGSPVEIALGTADSRAVVEFRDHGPGISEADRDKVFERFYRSDTSRTRAKGGSGLGLAIVSGILCAHHGSAKLSKTAGGGLTVRIELPITGEADRR